MKKVKKDAGDLERGNRDAYFRSTKAPEPIDLAPGTEVGYTRYFLIQLAVGPTDEMWRRRGVVKGLHPTIKDWAMVLWDDEDEPKPTNTRVLAKPGPNLRWAE